MTTQAGLTNSMGGPGTSSNVAMLLIFREGFVNWDFGHAAAIGYVLAFIIIILHIYNYALINRIVGTRNE